MSAATLTKPGKGKAPKEVLPAVQIDAALQGKIRTGRQEANQFLIERFEEIWLAFVALISGRHLMLVGPPGTGKSLLARLLCTLIQGRIFDFQFNKYTSPEEVFGPLDIPSLTGEKGGQSQYVRVTTSMLPEADIAHFDELGKASTAILNTLLRITNEGEFINNGQVIRVPLLVAIASANEWIGDGEGMKETAALFDRFTLRKTIRQISTPAGRDRLLFDDSIDRAKFSVTLTPAEIRQARQEAMTIPFSQQTKDVLKLILQDLQNAGIVVGDRRQRWSVGVARAAAYLAGASAVEPDHLEILKHVLWAEPIEQPAKVEPIIMKRANPSAAKVIKLLGDAEDVVNNTNTKDLTATITSSKKLEEIQDQLEGMKDSDRKAAAMEFVTEHIRSLKLAAIGGL